jgi:predicted Zn-dependent protease
MVTFRARFNPLSTLAVLLVLVGVLGILRDRMPIGQPPVRCDPADAACESQPGPSVGGATDGRAAAPTLSAEEVCRDGGYLCAALEQTDRVRIQRWKNFSGTLVVHVPRPDFEEPGDAIELQTAAALGVRAWNNQPFPILVDMRGNRDPHFSVRWTRSLGGTQIGAARSRWSAATGMTVLSIELTTRSPFDPNQVSDSRKVRLTAAHEMGHALGLPHSDSRRDVMYPSNTATAVSAQDRRTMELLYQLEDGTEIVR